MEDNDETVEANPVTFPLNGFDGHCGAPAGYDGDGDDFFTFIGVEDDYLSMTMTGTDFGYDFDLYLYDSDGDTLASSESTGPNEAINYQLVAGDASPFFLEVYAYSGGGFYSLNGTLSPLKLWDKNVIDDSTSSLLGSWAVLTVTGGKPGCFYRDGVNGDVYFAYSNDVDGMGTWAINPVDTAGDPLGSWMSGGVINGYPAVTYIDDSNGGVVFAMCDSVSGAGTWNISTVDVDGANDPSTAEINGYPAVAYEGAGDTLCYAINDAADGIGTWTIHQVEVGAGGYYTSLIALPNGYPGISYNAFNDSEVHFASGSSYDGSGTWTVTVVDSSDNYPTTSAAIVQGLPAVAYYDTNNHVWYAINSSADGTGTWTAAQVSYRYMVEYVSLCVINGYPAICYSDNNEDMYYDVSVELDGTGTWSDDPVVWDAVIGSNRSLGWVNNQPACVFMNAVDNWVGFAAPAP